MIGVLSGTLASQLASWRGNQKFVGLLARINTQDLNLIGQWIQSGNINPVIDRRHTLTELPEAIRYLEEGHARGKVVISVS